MARAQINTQVSGVAGADGYGTLTEPDVPEKAGKVLRAIRVVVAPSIDGSLDEAMWALADSAAGLVQWDPDNMEAMSEGTVVRVLHDDRFLYVGVDVQDAEPQSVRGGLGRRDRPPPSDFVLVAFDTQHDHLSGYAFLANASGVQQDVYHFDDTNQDLEYNAVWEVRTQRTARGWSAEYRIPFSQMRFQAPPAGRVVWGFDFRRRIHRRNEEGQWVGRPRGAPGVVSRWGHLVFEDGIARPRRVELLPFVVARADDPATGATTGASDAGLDVRTGLGRSATLSATFNPDFGQVEADPAVLNLSVFETFFPEKRPFFLEDGTMFVPSYPLMTLFHSRRIGRRPGTLPLHVGDVLVERPEQTTILGAGKVTAKRGGTTYGAVTALTAAEYAIVETPTSSGPPARARRLIEPTTSYSAVRVQRDLGQGSNVGAIATTVLRDGQPDATAGGIDYRLRWSRNRWMLNGHWAVAHAPLGARMVTGVGGVSNLVYTSRHWGGNLHVDHFSREFRITDMGFLRARQDRTQLSGGIYYGNPDRGAVWRSWNAGLFVGAARNGDGLDIGSYAGTTSSLTTHGFWSASVNLYYSPDGFDDLETRGGPPVLVPSNWSGSLALTSDPRRSWNLNVQGSFLRDRTGSSNWSINPAIDVRPSPRLELSLATGYSANRDVAQWVRNHDVDGDGSVEHLFGAFESHVVNVTVRGSAALDRNVTIEAFLQPFVAVGDYGPLEMLARPRSLAFEPVAGDTGPDPAFNSKSLRGTVVMRWEYLPGSTVYLAWNMVGADASRAGRFGPLRDLRDALDAPLDHRVQLKASYWLSW